MNANIEYAQMLLQEFQEICKANKIDYKIVWGPEEIGTGVLMNSDGCRSFLSAAEEASRDDRTVESWLNSESYPDETLRYIGTDSLCYNILDYDNYKSHGIFIEINIVRRIDASAGDKKLRALISSLKRDAYSFTMWRKPKYEWFQKRIFKRAVKKNGSIGALKKNIFKTKILNAECVSLDSQIAENFNYKTYTKDYSANCIVEADISGCELFAMSEFKDTLAESLPEMRTLRKKIETHKKSGRANNKIAENVWNTVIEIDSKIRLMEEGSLVPDKEQINSEGAEKQ